MGYSFQVRQPYALVCIRRQLFQLPIDITLNSQDLLVIDPRDPSRTGSTQSTGGRKLNKEADSCGTNFFFAKWRECCL